MVIGKKKKRMFDMCLDDSSIYPNVVEDFKLFENVTEMLMKIVFEDAIDHGLFGMLSDGQNGRLL